MSYYMSFDRSDWARLRFSTPLTITEADLNRIKGVNEHITIEEVEEIYLPLSRLLNLYVLGSQNLYELTYTFLGTLPKRVPYIIGIAGSVAVGKSTTARLIKSLLENWPDKPKVDLISTDGFLYPNNILEKNGLMKKKGFPESYDVVQLFNFLKEVKSGAEKIAVPIYSHKVYDIVSEKYQIIERPDILIVEGLNVLQTPKNKKFYISDFFDFTIYIHAEEKNIKKWYIERFETLRQTAFQDKDSYFHRYTQLTKNDALDLAEKFWNEINSINLKENIYPTQQRARLILEKGENHLIRNIKLRKL